LTFDSQKDNRMHGSQRSSRPPRRARLLVRAALVLGWVAPAAGLAGDWPQILGPQRNGKAAGESIALPLPTAQAATQWEMPVGQGFAGVAVSQGSAVLFHRLGDELVVQRLDADTGQARWRVSFATSYRSTISPDDGPRCVPLLDRQRVYLLGPGGELCCLRLDDGQQVWARNIVQDFRVPDSYFGAGSSPIVEGDKLLLNAGGPQGAGIVALALADGATLWKSTSEGASYSSPVAATIGGTRHLVFVTRLHVLSLDPQDGKVRFRFPFGARGPTVNAANPLVLGEHLFASASYGVGANWSKIGPSAATEVWANDDVMSSQYTTCMEHEGFLYGIDGRQDMGRARLRCFDPRSGTVQWTEEGFGTGNLILAGDKLLIMRTAGDLVVVAADPRAYRELARMPIFDTTVQALPALSDGLLLVRDTRRLKCLRLGPPAGKPPAR
jgi:outer membrane protein assembly factor BamB